MAKKDELIATAKSLGLPTKGLNVAQLEKAIADKNAADANKETNPKEVKEIVVNADTIKETIEKALELGVETKGVSFEDVVKAIETKETELAEAKAQKEASEKDAEKALKNAFKYDGKFYGLSERCPETLKVLDTVYKQKELLKNKDAMEFLIVGNSCFIKRLK